MSAEDVPETAPEAGLGTEAPRGMAAGLDPTAPAPVDTIVPQGSPSAGAVVEETPSVARRRWVRLRPIHLTASIRTFDAFHYRDYRLLLGRHGLLLFSWNSSYVLAFPCLVLLSSGMVMFFTTTTIQSTVRDDLRGRVAGLYMVTWRLFPVGSLAAGSLAERFGAPVAPLVAAGVLAIVFVPLAVRFRVLWRIR